MSSLVAVTVALIVVTSQRTINIGKIITNM